MGLHIHLLCIPSFQHHAQSAPENTSRPGNSAAGVPILVDTNVANVIHYSHGNADIFSSGTPGGSSNISPIQTRFPPSYDLQGEALFRHCIRQSFEANNISPDLAQFVIDSKPKQHQASIGSQLSKWNQFCVAREIDPRNPTAEQMGVYITFLSRQLSNGKMIANYFSRMRKFLSDTALAKSYSIPIKQLLVAAIHAKPALPKLPGEVWNADKVLVYFLRSPPNCYLTKLQLAGKCIVLLMLASGRRKVDLMALDVQPQFIQKTDNVFFFTMSKLSKGNSPFTPQNNFMQYIEFHKFNAAPQICPYTVIEDFFQIIRNNQAIKPTYSQFFVTTTDCQKPAHAETVRRWAIDTLKLAGINCTPHSIRSAHASMAVAHNENIDSIMERCGWRHSSTFYKHYLRPVASGEKPTTPAGVTIDTTTFFCPPKLMKPGVRVIPPPPEYVPQSDIFPCGTTDPTDIQNKPVPPMQSSLDKYRRKTATEQEIAQIDSEEAAEQLQANIEVTEALLAAGSPPQETTPAPEVKDEIKTKSTPHSKAQPKKTPYLVITSDTDLQATKTIFLRKENDQHTTTAVHKETMTPYKKICTAHVSKLKLAVELKLSPQYLTLRSRKLVRKSFSKKTYPKKRELRSILPKASTVTPVINNHY